MKSQFFSLIVFVILFSSCADDDVVIPAYEPLLPCSPTILEIRKNIDDCEPLGFYRICGIYDVDEIIYLEEENLDWIPMACQKIEEQIFYKNQSQEQTSIKITNREHFIQHQLLSSACSVNNEHVNFVCQKNEVLAVEFLSDKFGLDPLHLELTSVIVNVTDENPDPSVTQIKLSQRRLNTNIADFSFAINVKDMEFDSWFRTYHASINLLNIEYSDVIELKLAQNVAAIPHTRVYLKKGIGILGFERNGELWIQM